MTKVAKLAGRVPPHNLDAECSLIGGVLLDPESFADVAGVVAPGDFYSPQHAKVFEAMHALSLASKPIDRVTLKAQLVERGQLDQAGGEAAIDLFDKIVPTAPNLGYYAKIIKEKATARSLIGAASAIVSLAYEQHGEFGAFLDECEERIAAVRGGRSVGGEWIGPAEAAAGAMKRVGERYENPSSIIGLSTGLSDLDMLTSGLHPGQLVILAARPSMGKTALALQIADEVSTAGHGVGVFSLEMTHDELVPRVLAGSAKIDGQTMRSGKLSEAQWAKLTVAFQKYASRGIYIDDSMVSSVLDMRTKARRLAQKLRGTKTPLALIVVDYLQLAGNFGEGREQEIAAISRGLKALAKELNVPVLALSQLNRKAESENRRPRLSDLRDSGAIEQDADVVLFIHRASLEDTVAEIIIGKQRNGPIGTVPVAFLSQYMRFANHTNAEQR